MAHLLTIQDIKIERSRLLNSIEILPMSYKFTDAEKTALLEIYKVQLSLYDTAIARNINFIKEKAV